MVLIFLQQQLMNSQNLIKNQFSFQSPSKSSQISLNYQISQQNKKKKKSQKKVQMQTQGKNIGHWTIDEKVKYYIFLEEHKNHFFNKEMRRTDKIFKQMSKYLGTRAADQCRSHHQKMQKKYQTFEVILEIHRLEYSGKVEKQGFKNSYQNITNCSPQTSCHEFSSGNGLGELYFREQLFEGENDRQNLGMRFGDENKKMRQQLQKYEDFLNYDIDKFLI